MTLHIFATSLQLVEEEREVDPFYGAMCARMASGRECLEVSDEQVGI